jgi:hypothetical protein
MDMGKISKPTLNRLRKELTQIQKEPPPNIAVACDEADILNFHYIITGPPGTVYAGGEVLTACSSGVSVRPIFASEFSHSPAVPRTGPLPARIPV